MGGDVLTWPDLLARLVAGVDLDAADTDWVMDRVLAGEATPVQLAGFLVALRSKGETAAEITGLAAAMLRHARRVTVAGLAVDVVGTGGDRAKTVNISTMSAVVIAGAGIPVVKHGNRAASSACGSADAADRIGSRISARAIWTKAVSASAGPLTSTLVRRRSSARQSAAGTTRKVARRCARRRISESVSMRRPPATESTSTRICLLKCMRSSTSVRAEICADGAFFV